MVKSRFIFWNNNFIFFDLVYNQGKLCLGHKCYTLVLLALIIIKLDYHILVLGTQHFISTMF